MRNKSVLISIIICLSFTNNYSQFIDNFSNRAHPDQVVINDWDFFTGSGNAEIKLYYASDSTASISLDATKDELNVWWGIIKTNVASKLDLSNIEESKFELRVEARVKSSHAPRRVNLSFNTQRTTDFHSNLREYDIPDTNNWHTISMTTEKFDAKKGDDVNVQLAMIDWGLSHYLLEIDYIKVDLVDPESINQDLGDPIIYHPPIPSIDLFTDQLAVSQNTMVCSKYKDINFYHWSTIEDHDTSRLLSVNSSQIVLLRWDFSDLSDKRVENIAVLELWCKDQKKLTNISKDFGQIRVCEIIGGKRNWKEEELTYEDFLDGQNIEDVINSQMIIDVDLIASNSEPTLVSISKPVMNRLISGKTLGIALLPLGAIEASFYSNSEEDGTLHPKIYFNLKTE